MIRFAIYLLLFFSISDLSGQTDKSEILELIDSKEYASAESNLRVYLEYYPKDLQAKELLGDSYGYQEKWDLAIETYSELIEEGLVNANLHYKLGGSLGMKALSVNKLKALMLVSDIKKSLKEAIRLDPSHIDAHWALIEFYMALPGILGGGAEEALYYADRLETISKVDGFLSKGYVYEYDHQEKLAEQYYLKAVEIGGSIVCYKELTDFYENIDQPEKAIQTIENAQTAHPRNALHYQLGKVSADYNVELDKGLQCLAQYIEDYSAKDGVPLEWAYYRRAQIYRHKNNKEQALISIRKALSIREEFPQALEEKSRIQQL